MSVGKVRRFRNGDDVITVERLENGMLKITTDAISPANHVNATQFTDVLIKRMGGEAEWEKRTDVEEHVHLHEHGIEHSHE